MAPAHLPLVVELVVLMGHDDGLWLQLAMAARQVWRDDPIRYADTLQLQSTFYTYIADDIIETQRAEELNSDIYNWWISPFETNFDSD